MGEDGVRAACPDRRQPSSLLRQIRVAEGEDAGMDTVETAGGDTFPNRIRAQSEFTKLRMGDNPVLSGGEPGSAVLDPFPAPPKGRKPAHISRFRPVGRGHGWDRVADGRACVAVAVPKSKREGPGVCRALLKSLAC